MLTVENQKKIEKWEKIPQNHNYGSCHRAKTTALSILVSFHVSPFSCPNALKKLITTKDL